MRKLLTGAVLALASVGSWGVTTTLQALTYTDYYDGDTRSDYAASGFFSNINFGGQKARGFAEFSLDGFNRFSGIQSATLSFSILGSTGIDSASYPLSYFFGDYSPSKSRYSTPGTTLISLDFSDFLVGTTFLVDADFPTAIGVANGAKSVGFTVPRVPYPTSYSGFGINGPPVLSLNNWTLSIVSNLPPVSAVPEPGQSVLLISGLIVFGAYFRRRACNHATRFAG